MKYPWFPCRRRRCSLHSNVFFVARKKKRFRSSLGVGLVAWYVFILAPFITYTRRKEGRKTKTKIASSLGSTKRRTFWLNVRTFRADVYPPTGQGNRVRWQQVPQARDTLIRWWGVFGWISSPSHFEIVSCYFTRRDNSSCTACNDGRIWQTHVAVASATLASSSCHELRQWWAWAIHALCESMYAYS